MMTGTRENELMEAANLLLDARREAAPIADLPEALRPVTQDEAYFVQDRMAEAYDEIGGWKIGAGTPEATPAFAPMPRNWIAASGAELTDLPGGKQWRYRGLEAEIAFLMGEDLPPRETPYTRERAVGGVLGADDNMASLGDHSAQGGTARQVHDVNGDAQSHR